MDIKITNDGKGKRQSHEAKAEFDINYPDGYARVSFVAFGGDESEARRNLQDLIDAVLR